ncbi:MAG: hypothetical protein ACI8V8_000372 [Chitinophagales bacterium]|jgi:hypothetical protein
MKNIIFHIPFEIDPNRSSGTNIRPLKMLQAFRNIGFQVDIVMGNGAERKKSILKIKEQLRLGKTYDFVYSESSTLPTLLTEKNHFPSYPFLDFGFFRFCKKNNIPITLFYRDIFWNFKGYSLKGIKAFFTKIMYHYDLYRYKDLLDILYLPSFQMKDFIPSSFNYKIDDLPPGFQELELNKDKSPSSKLNIFYVGGFSSHYQMEELFKAVSQLEFINLTICTREAEWLSAKKGTYASYAGLKNLHVVHKQSHELEELYQESDIALLFVKPFDYWRFAVPIKLFEYIGHMKPIIATKGTYPGIFVENHNIGWSIKYDSNTLIDLLKNLNRNRTEIESKQAHLTIAYENNTWEARARKVMNQVKELSQ